MFAHCAILLIRVEELPRPQFFGKSRCVLTFHPLFSPKNNGFNFLASCSIFKSVSFVEFGTVMAFLVLFSSSKVNEFSNHIIPLQSRLFQWTASDSAGSTTIDCPNFVGMLRAIAPSSTTYSPVRISLPLL